MKIQLETFYNEMIRLKTEKAAIQPDQTLRCVHLFFANVVLMSSDTCVGLPLVVCPTKPACVLVLLSLSLVLHQNVCWFDRTSFLCIILLCSPLPCQLACVEPR